MKRSISTEALVLAATDVGEEDRILTFLTPDMGLLRAAATSARNLKKGRAAPLDLFVQTRLDVNFPRKDGKLKRIGSTAIVDPFLGIRANFRSLCAASYIGQMVTHCIQEDDPSPGIWDIVLYSLRCLDSGSTPYIVILPFEVILLREMGVFPDLIHCLKCSRRVTKEAYLDVKEGGVFHSTCSSTGSEATLTGGDLAVLRYLAKRDLSAVSRLSIKEGDALRVFEILHPFAIHHLGYEAKALKMLKK